MCGTQHRHLDLRMLEPQTLDRVMQLDVHAEVVGVELQLIAVVETSVYVDVENEICPWRLDL